MVDLFVIPYDPDKINWHELLAPQQGTGKFVGVPFQRGNGLGSILRVVRHYVPLFAQSPIGQEITKQVSNIASDINAGVTPTQAVKTRARQGLRNLTGFGRHTNNKRRAKRSNFVSAP